MSAKCRKQTLAGPDAAMLPHSAIVFALRRPNERGPAATIYQHRSNNLVPDLRLHVSKFVEDDAIEIRTT